MHAPITSHPAETNDHGVCATGQTLLFFAEKEPRPPYCGNTLPSPAHPWHASSPAMVRDRPPCSCASSTAWLITPAEGDDDCPVRSINDNDEGRRSIFPFCGWQEEERGQRRGAASLMNMPFSIVPCIRPPRAKIRGPLRHAPSPSRTSSSTSCASRQSIPWPPPRWRRPRWPGRSRACRPTFYTS